MDENTEIQNNSEQIEINNIENQINSSIFSINNSEIFNNNYLIDDLSLTSDFSFFNFDSNSSIFQTIETMISQISTQNIYNYTNDDDVIQFNIEVELIQPENDLENKKFTSCKEINEKLGKSKKIDESLYNNKLLNETCFICIDEYKKSELLRTLPNCNHYFHKKCIDKWLIKYKSSCPVCRNLLIP